MEKIKSLLSSHSKDDEVTHNTSNTSNVVGDGSHAGNTPHSSHTTERAAEKAAERDAGLNSHSLSSGKTTHNDTRSAASAVPSHLGHSTADDAASTAEIRSGVIGSPQGSNNLHSVPGTTGTSGTHHQHHEHEHQHQQHNPTDRTAASGVSSTLGGTHEHRGFEPASTQSGPHVTHIANVLDPKVHVPGEFPTLTGEPADLGSTRGTSSTTTGGPLGTHQHGTHQHGTHQHGSGLNDAPLASSGGFEDQRFDPSGRSSDTHGTGFPSSTSHQTGTLHSGEHAGTGHNGRNAALGGTAAGAAGVGAYEAGRSNRGDTGPASKTLGHHESNLANVVDPRVRPEPEKMKDHTTSGPYQSDTLNKVDPRVDSTNRNVDDKHHHGRDAAVAGGLGAGGVGAYEASRHPGSTAHGSNLTSDTHSGAIGGTSSSGYPTDARTTNSGLHSGIHSGGVGGTSTSGYPNDTRSVDPTHSATHKDHHYGRDAALVGGAGAGGAAAYGATHNDGLAPHSTQQPLSTPTGAPHDARVFDQTQQVPGSNQVAGGWAADSKAEEKLQKERIKEAEKSHHKAEKQYEKAENKHEKQYEKAEKQHEKAEMKHEKQHEKAEKANEQGEKKHGILGFLHHDKEPKDTAEERHLKEQGNLREADQVAHARHQRELEAGAAAGTVGVAGASFEPSLREQQLEHHDGSSGLRTSTDERGHNKLHKDPSAKVQRELEERSREHGTIGGTSTTGTTGAYGNTGATGTSGAYDNTNATGAYGTTGTGHTGASHPGHTDHIGHNTQRTHNTGANDGIVTEPRTGLPMNVGKYGSGQGGTDGSRTIPGYQN